MVVAASAMHMAMRNLFGRGGTNAHDLEVKPQSLACMGVIPVQMDGVTLDLHDGEDLGDAIVIASFQLPAHLHTRGEIPLGNRAHEPLISLPEGVGRLQVQQHTVAGFLPIKSGFNPGQGVVVPPVQVDHGLAALFHNPPLGICHPEVQGHHSVFVDFHGHDFAARTALQFKAARNYLPNLMPETDSSVAKPPERTAPAVLQRLYELYPQMFGARFLPLQLGAYQELLARRPEEFRKEDLKQAMGVHARSTRYLECVANGEKRHDLEGRPVGELAPEHVHHAIIEVFRRRRSRSRQNPLPWLRERLVRAIERSGMEGEAYAACFVHTDAEIADAVGQACAEVAERRARREALVRAYESSGRNVAAFAEMYGLDAAVVQQALGVGRSG